MALIGAAALLLLKQGKGGVVPKGEVADAKNESETTAIVAKDTSLVRGAVASDIQLKYGAGSDIAKNQARAASQLQLAGALASLTVTAFSINVVAGVVVLFVSVVIIMVVSLFDWAEKRAQYQAHVARGQAGAHSDLFAAWDKAFALTVKALLEKGATEAQAAAVAAYVCDGYICHRNTIHFRTQQVGNIGASVNVFDSETAWEDHKRAYRIFKLKTLGSDGKSPGARGAPPTAAPQWDGFLGAIDYERLGLVGAPFIWPDGSIDITGCRGNSTDVAGAFKDSKVQASHIDFFYAGVVWANVECLVLGMQEAKARAPNATESECLQSLIATNGVLGSMKQGEALLEYRGQRYDFRDYLPKQG
jgi:hypothetical protein